LVLLLYRCILPGHVAQLVSCKSDLPRHNFTRDIGLRISIDMADFTLSSYTQCTYTHPFFLLALALGSKTYTLRSCLHPFIAEQAALTDEQILEQEHADTSFDDSDDEDDNGADDDVRRPRPYGSLISWSTTDQLGPLGILYVILALILVGGKVMTDGMSIVSFTPTKLNNSPKQSISVPN
jgi:hypothetical protein